jgi:G:T-mismatch repair DNA endonuclease (very short patch repair protein)
MADVHTKQQRRYNMQQIRSANTRPEMLVRPLMLASAPTSSVLSL